MAAGGISMLIVSLFTRIYTDTNGGPGLTIYRPRCPPGFCSLGDYAQEGDINTPNHGVMLCIKKHSKLVTNARGFIQVWSSEGPSSGNGYESDCDDEDNCEGSGGSGSGSPSVLAFWEPKIPSDDYIALGHLATTSYDPPVDCHVCVVHKSVAVPGVPGSRLWMEISRMSSLWGLAPSYHYVATGTFISSDSKAAPHVSQFWSLTREVIPPPSNATLTIKTLTKEDLSLIYQDQESGAPEHISVYLPQAPIGYATLGHYAESGYKKTRHSRALVVKETGAKGLLRHPVTYKEVWKMTSGGTRTEAAIWEPVPPPGFFCLGHVLSVGFEVPSTNAVACLHWSVVGRGRRGKRIWWNKSAPEVKRNHKKDVTIWQVTGQDDCLTANTFVVNRGFHLPHTEQTLFNCFYLNDAMVSLR